MLEDGQEPSKVLHLFCIDICSSNGNLVTVLAGRWLQSKLSIPWAGRRPNDPTPTAHTHTLTFTCYAGLNVYAAMIDSELDRNGFIVPGLGDAGDRAFGTQ